MYWNIYCVGYAEYFNFLSYQYHLEYAIMCAH